MRGFGFSLKSFLVLVFSAFLLSSVSAGTTKEHKKKLLEKLRAALNASDTEAAVAAVASVEELDKDSMAEKVAPVIPEVSTSTSESVVYEALPLNKDGETTPSEVTLQSTNNYMAQFRSILKRILSMLGFRKEKIKDKDGRTNRMLDFETNEVDLPIYRNEVRTTVGAVMGQKECIQKVACGAGSYLKYVKGKQLIFALLENLSPTAWKDTVKVIKQSAILGEKCNFKCLEDDLI